MGFQLGWWPVPKATGHWTLLSGATTCHPNVLNVAPKRGRQAKSILHNSSRQSWKTSGQNKLRGGKEEQEIKRHKANKSRDSSVFNLPASTVLLFILSASWPQQQQQHVSHSRETDRQRQGAVLGVEVGCEADSKRANKSNFSKTGEREKEKPVTGIFVHLISCVITGLIVRDKFNFKFSGHKKGRRSKRRTRRRGAGKEGREAGRELSRTSG